MINDIIPQGQTRHTDYRDLCIEEAVARIADLEHDMVVYREIATGAIHESHRLYTALQRERQQRLDLAAEFRAFRRRAMADALRSRRNDKPRPAHLPISDSEPPRPYA